MTDIAGLSVFLHLKKLVITNSGLKSFQADLSGSKIENLDISENHYLKKIDGVASLYLLKQLELQGMDSIESLSFDMSRMNLTKLRIDNLNELKNIPGISTCKSLKELDLHRLGSIKALAFDMSDMNMETVYIGELKNLTKIDGIAACRSLKNLVIYGTAIRKLPEHMTNMECLESFQFSGDQLADISELKGMKSLKSVEISNAPLITTLPASFNTNLKLESVKFIFLKNLRSAEGLTGLKNLKSINICLLNKNFSLPERLATCENLETIVILTRVNDLSPIKNLLKLTKLEIHDCPFAVVPAEMFTNENLRDLEIHYNDAIIDLSSVTRFKNLKRLDIEDNGHLTTIPDLYKKPQLIARNNKNLKIPDSYKGQEWGYMIEGNGGFVNSN